MAKQGPPNHTQAEKREMAIKFKNFRKAHGLSQLALAKLMGGERTAISQIENSRHYPAYKTLKRFAKAQARLGAPS